MTDLGLTNRWWSRPEHDSPRCPRPKRRRSGQVQSCWPPAACHSISRGKRWKRHRSRSRKAVQVRRGRDLRWRALGGRGRPRHGSKRQFGKGQGRRLVTHDGSFGYSSHWASCSPPRIASRECLSSTPNGLTVGEDVCRAVPVGVPRHHWSTLLQGGRTPKIQYRLVETAWKKPVIFFRELATRR